MLLLVRLRFYVAPMAGTGLQINLSMFRENCREPGELASPGHLEGDRKLLPIKFWMKSSGRTPETEIASCFCHKIGIEVIILATV